MMRLVAYFLAFIPVFTVLPACAQESESASAETSLVLPDLARALIDAAYRTEDPVQVAAVANAAREVFPGHGRAIDAYADLKRAALASPLSVGGAGDEVVVVAEAEEEKAAPGADSTPDRVKFKPGKAPKFLALGPWDGKVAASGVIASGNSRNAAAGLKIEAHRKAGALTHNIDALFDYGKSNGTATQQRWGLAYKLDVLIDETTYGYARTSYTEDAFSGFDYKLFAGVGVGHFLRKSEAFHWKIEGGPGYQYAPIDDARSVDKRTAVYASNEIDWVIRDGLKFEQDLNATWTSPSTTLISHSTLTTELSETLSTGISYFYRYETNPPDGKLKEDTTFRVNLTYGF